MAIKTIGVTKSKLPVAEFLRELGPARQPIELVLGGQRVARLVPPHELTEAEKEQVLQKGRAVLAKARSRTKGVPERKLAEIVDAAVRRVRPGR